MTGPLHDIPGDAAPQEIEARRTDSLGRRYLFKLSANIVNLVVNLPIQAMVPRGLGPTAYGQYNYLTSFFNEAFNFANLGTIDAFYTKLSQRPDEKELVSFYLFFFVAINLAGLAITVLIDWSGLAALIWPGQEFRFILLAAIWGITTQFMALFFKMADAYGLTTHSELARMAYRIVSLAVIAVLFFTRRLTLENYFYYYLSVTAALCTGLALLIRTKGFSFPLNPSYGLRKLKPYLAEFYRYCHPVFVYTMFGMLSVIIDRWLLQTFGGNVQQGYYGLAYQVGIVCFLFTGAMTPLLMREFSLAFFRHDSREMARLFRRYIPLLYSVAAYFCCFIMVQAENVTFLLGGTEYRAAIVPVVIMSFYPIHQTYSQLCGAVFFATGQTGTLRNISVFYFVLGFPISFLLIAPARHWGLDLGATGLAVKMVLIQFLIVITELYYNTRYLDLKLRPFLWHQVLAVGVFIAAALGASSAAGLVLGPGTGRLLLFILSGMIYTLISLIAVYIHPFITGLSRADIDTLSKRAISYLNKNKFSAGN